MIFDATLSGWYHGQSTHVYNIKSILKSDFLANSEKMCSPFFTRNKLFANFEAIKLGVQGETDLGQ